MQAADRMAIQLKTKYGVESRWQGDDTLHLVRAGTRGKFHLSLRAIRFELKLGMMLAGFRDPIVREIERILDESLKE
jgi:putative polyhydroxyalkanoate system protein